MRKLPFIIFLAFVAGAMVVGIGSYKATERSIRQDVYQALAATIQELSCDRIDADTIRCYRSHITIAEVRDTACITMRVVGSGKRQRTELVADHGCGFTDVLLMSDQRASGALLAAGLLWVLLSLWHARRRVGMAAGMVYGGLLYDTNKACFATADGHVIKLTPMQQQLMEMFFEKDNHMLTKQEICNRLWPKKPDASETLYTLVRRLKQVIESNSQLRIESERGKTYRLVDYCL